MKTKEHVFSILKDAAGNSVSGEDLAAQCGVSRTAVWKAVSALRTEGHVLEAGTNRGYRLVQNFEALDAAVIEKHLAELSADAYNPDVSDVYSGKVRVFKVTDSTNTEAKKAVSEAVFLHAADGSLSAEGKALHGTAFLAETQTSGRGRLGRTFYSPPCTGLYVSIVYIPNGGMQDPAFLTASSAVGVCRALERVYSVRPQIKWVNDIFLRGKKICGMLAEGVSNFETGIIEAVVIGIGINIAENDGGFPEQLASVAGTVLPPDAAAATCRLELRRNEFASAVIYEVLSALDESMKAGSEPAAVHPVMEEFRNRSLFIPGQELTVFPLAGDESSKYIAYFVSIDDNARLVVELPDGTRRSLASGEVTLRSSFAADGGKSAT